MQSTAMCGAWEDDAFTPTWVAGPHACCAVGGLGRAGCVPPCAMAIQPHHLTPLPPISNFIFPPTGTRTQ